MVMQLKRSRALVGTGILLAGVMALGGCAATETPEEPQEVDWYVNITGTLTEAVYQSVIDDFNVEHPNVTVRLLNSGGQDYATFLATLVASGNAPDVVGSTPITPDNEEQFVDLSDEAWAQEAAAEPGLGQAGLFGDAIYYVPTAYQISGVFFYNKTMFEDAGITELPTTWEEVDEAAAALKAAGYVPIATSGGFVPGAQLRMQAYQEFMDDGDQWLEDRYAGDATFVDSAWQNVLERTQRWIQEGYVRSDALGLDYGTVAADFATGGYGMFPIGSFLNANVDQATDPADIGVFPLPSSSSDDLPPRAVNPTMGWSVLTAGRHEDAGRTLVEFLSTDSDAINILVKADGGLSPYTSFEMSPLLTELQDLGDASTPISFERGDNVPPPGFPQGVLSLSQKLFTGSSPADIAAEMDQWWTSNVGQ
ncbi:ABC transporter substrate-binding protein [Protaetiibacter mangrovi]|uniref:Extracellular solute-binding protein n=2 Tax=Microbacteriaceae TaxID=85023 RepID=A0ABT1ZHB5_9MICO|nr:extracellular solute-binding protein [Protaetiibacter mangrovi]MCS0500090.1 extracellular solute-binding protein [Protaetiibacter mangrovi]TPX04508.1 extracellular solute-binding protein [Schumannella luteola]